MTNPDTLTHGQCIRYIRQLQKTVEYWQTLHAVSAGLTREAMVAQAIRMPRVPEPEFRQTYHCEFIEP